MANTQNSNRDITPRGGGFFQDLTNRFRLISRLLADSRVNPWLKILPVATLAYVITPIDLLPVNPIDDAFIIWVGTTLFVELCPPNVVDEHMRSLLGRVMPDQWRDLSSSAQEGPVVEGEYYENDPNQQRTRK